MAHRNTGKMEVFGIDITDEHSKCSNRPGIIEVKDPDATGGWRAFCVHNIGEGDDIEPGSPKVFGCEHEAIGMLVESIQAMGRAVIDGDLPQEVFLKALPRPSHLRYTYVDVEPEDAEVTTTDDAKALLAKVMGGAV